jgi:CRISPR-associated protein (TIGR02710 family)
MPFSDQLAAFRARTRDPGFTALILLGTRQPITAALLIGTLSVERVAFLLTDATRQMPERVAGLLGRTADDWLCPEGDHSTTRAVYQGMRQVLDQWSDLDRRTIAVDVTGGLKPMSVGLEKAAHVLGLTTIYVESDYGPQPPDGKPGPVPGTQRLVIPEDPYVVFGDLEAAEARRLYAAHDYAGAQRIFGALAARVRPTQPDGDPTLVALAARYDTLARLAAAYAAWDAFDLPTAERLLADLVAANAFARDTNERLSAQVAALRCMNTANLQSLALLHDEPTVLALLGSLHANALRREAQGRFDVAALLRYRCLELIAQQRLATYGILAERPNFRAARQRRPDLEQRYQEVQRAQGRQRTYPLPDRAFGLFVGYMLLAALDDPLVQGFALARIEQRTEARNKSILAHGYRLITEAEYRQFSEVVEEMLDRYFDVLRQDRQPWETMYRFVGVPD